MKEYTISPELAASLEKAFAPFLAYQVREKTRAGEVKETPLAQWIVQQHAKLDRPLPDPMLGVMLANTLENVFVLEGGKEGVSLLEALDGVIHGGGEPELTIHGLPKQGPLSPIIREAFRQKMFLDPAKAMPYQPHMKDIPARFEAAGFRQGSYSTLHQDDEDITLLFGDKGGLNPRHTVVMTLDQFYENVAAHARQAGVRVTSDMVRELAHLPVWIVDPVVDRTTANPIFHGQRNQARIERAEALGLIRIGINAQGFERSYAPLTYPNPQYHPDEKDRAGNIVSPRDQLLLAPEGHFLQRIDPDRTAVPAHLLPVLDACVAAMRDVVMNKGKAAKQGSVLQEGDLKVLNNRALLHAGGAFVYDALPVTTRWFTRNYTPREIVAMDVSCKPSEYGVRPGDRVAQPIHYGKMQNGKQVAEVDTAVAAR